MFYTGIDYHKRYSVLCTVDASGQCVQSARVAQNEPAAFAAYFQRLPAPSEAVLDACWNWGWLHTAETMAAARDDLAVREQHVPDRRLPPR